MRTWPKSSDLSASRITTETSQTRLRAALSQLSFSCNAWKPSAAIPSISKIPDAEKQRMPATTLRTNARPGADPDLYFSHGGIDIYVADARKKLTYFEDGIFQ